MELYKHKAKCICCKEYFYKRSGCKELKVEGFMFGFCKTCHHVPNLSFLLSFCFDVSCDKEKCLIELIKLRLSNKTWDEYLIYNTDDVS